MPQDPRKIPRCVRWALAQLGFGATAIEAVSETEGRPGRRKQRPRPGGTVQEKWWGKPGFA